MSRPAASLLSVRVPRVTTTRLPNGVRVVVVPVAHTARVHVTAQLRGGPVHEDDSTWGYSHLVEHMVFRGTRRHQDVRAVSLAADDFGGEVNAATWHERVAFDTRCDPDRVEDAFDLLASMLGAPRFMGLGVEREVVLEEIAELFDDDGQEVDADNLAFRRVFAGHALSRSIEGTPENLERATLARLRAFHKRNYGSENLVVSVAGPVAPEAALRAARRTFGKLPASPPPPPGTPPAPPARKKAVEVVRTDALQTSVRLCFPIVGAAHADAAAYAVLGRVLDDGPASRIQARVIDAQGLAYSVWCAADFFAERGVMEFGASVRHDKVGALVKSLVAEVNDLVKRAPHKNELTRLVDRNVRDTRDNLSEVTAIADAAGKGVLFGQPWQPKATLERIAAVKAVDVHRAARASFAGDKATLVLVGLPPRREVALATRALETLA